MSEQWLEELEALCEAATPRPWFWYNGIRALMSGHIEKIGWAIDVAWGRMFAQDDAEVGIDDADADFIAASRTAIPKLIAMVRKWEAAYRDAIVGYKKALLKADTIDVKLDETEAEIDELKRQIEQGCRFIDTATGEKDYEWPEEDPL